MTCAPSSVNNRGMWATALTVEDADPEEMWIEVEEHTGCQCQCAVRPQVSLSDMIK